MEDTNVIGLYSTPLLPLNSSGLKITWEKTCIVGIHLEEGYLSSLASPLGCKVEQLAIKFLGLPLGGRQNLGSF